VQALRNEKPDTPSLLQYERAKALVDLLKDKSDADLAKLARKLAAEALNDGRRVFIVIPAAGSDSALRKAIASATLEKSDKFPLTLKPITTWTEPQLKGQQARWELLEVLRR